MKKKALLISSLFIAFSMSMFAQYDDIYYNPRKANETRITTSNEETVVISNNVRDVDTYNRQAPANRPNQTSNVEQDDFEYTKRITRFHNPEAVTINNPEYVYIYNDTPSEPNPTINIRVTQRWNPWDYSYFTRYYYPSYHWSWDSNYGWGYTYNTYYPFYSTYPSSFYYGYYPPGYGYYGYGYYGYPSYYHHRPHYYHHPYHHQPTYTTRKGYNNYDRTPNYVNDGRGSSSSYGYQNSGQRSTRSVGTNPTNTNASSTRNTSTYNNRERTFNSAPSSSTQNTRKSDVTTNTSTPRETSSGRSFNSSSSSSNSNNSGTRSTQSSDNSSSSNGGSRSNGGRSFSR